MICTHCGSGEVEEDRTRGDVTCTNCGAVLEENLIVNEVEFQKNSSGGATVVGQFVNQDSQYFRREPRKITEAKAKERIEIVCGQLRMNEDVVKSAFSFYKTALFRGMTRGRDVQVVTAACVYLAARLLRMNIMLLDLSDVVRKNVYVLGRTYGEMKQRLNIVLPEMDPCLYIERFAAKLELGDKTRQVSNTAMRILQRMKKDWISTGRKPSGLAASALLVAARIFEFNRTYEDVARIARISQQTARLRLEEFGRTASSSLTIDEFLTVDYEQEHDPPAFTEGIKRANEAVVTEDDLRVIAEEMTELEKRIDEEMDKLKEKNKLKGPWAKYAKPDGTVSKGIRSLFDCSTSSNSDAAGQCAEEDILSEQYVLREALEDVVDGRYLDECVEDLSQVTGRHNKSLSCASDSQLDDSMSSLSTASLVHGADSMLKVAMSSSQSESVHPVIKGETESIELDLTGIDDEEIEREYLLTPREVIVKARTWLHENAEYLSLMKKKEAEKKKRLEEEAKNPPKKKIRRKRANSPLRNGTPGEAIHQLIQHKKLSNKINYDALLKLNTSDSQPSASSSSTCAPYGAVGKKDPETVPNAGGEIASNLQTPTTSKTGATNEVSQTAVKRELLEAAKSSTATPSKLRKIHPPPSAPHTLTSQSESLTLPSALRPLPSITSSLPKQEVVESVKESKGEPGPPASPPVEDDDEEEEDLDFDEIARRTQEEAADNWDDDLDDYCDDY